MNGWNVVLFYSVSRLDSEAMARGERWRENPPVQGVWTPGISVRRRLIPGFIEWAAHNWKGKFNTRNWGGADLLLGEYLEAVGISSHVSIPNLVDHNLKVPSLYGNAPVIFGHERRSRTWRLDAE